MNERTYATEKGTIHYWISELAPNAVTLVFLPGLTADHRLFDKQVEFFEPRCNVFVWDAPAHAASRPFEHGFSLADKARWLHGILERENVKFPLLIGQSMGGYVAQAFMQCFPGQAVGFISIDSAPLKRKYYPTWEVKFLRHTKGMYASIPWAILKPWGARGASESEYGRGLMRAFMDDYTKQEYVELAAHGYRMLADAVEADLPYDIDCPALLICGEKDHAGDVRPFNRRWAAGENLPLAWIEGAGHNSNTDRPDEVNALIAEFAGV